MSIKVDKMKYKLIAADMDGTLLNSESKLSQGNLEAIKKAMAQGVKFAVVTGRSVTSLKQFDFVAELNTPAIAYNGAKIYNMATDELIFEQGLDNEDALRLLDLAAVYGTTICAWSGDKYYTNTLNERSVTYGKMSWAEPIIIEDNKALAEQGVTKIIWNDSPERVQELIRELDKLKFNALSYCTSNPCFLETMNCSVSKAKSLGRLCDYYGIDSSEVIAVGDGENDLSMLQFAGLSVAMENASDSVKSKCKVVTDTNDNDGVARMIEKYCL